jgi:hypothetical protein
MWQWVRTLCLVAALLAVPLGAAATTIAQTAVDLSDAQGPGGDLWEISFAVSGFSFSANEGFSVGFDPDEYSFLLAPSSPSADWDVLLLQPDPLLPDFGVYDALALAPNASLTGVFTLRVIFTGASAPGLLPFTVNRFDASGALLATLESGTTIAAPEPSSAALLALCALGAGLAARRRPRARTRAGRRLAGLAAAALVLAACVPVTHTAQVGDVRLEYRQTASVRVGRTEAEYTFSVDVTNTGTVQLTGLSASVSSNDPATVIVDATMTFGDFAPGQKRTGVDTFTIRQDRTLAFDPARLAFQVASAPVPNPPTGLTALPGDGLAALAWSPNANPAATYAVHRSANGGGTFALLASGLTAPAHLDRSVVNGQPYVFAVTTTISGIESAQSAQVRVVAPGLSTATPPPTSAEAKLQGPALQLAQLLNAGESLAAAAAATQARISPQGLLLVEVVAANGVGQSVVADLQGLGAQNVLAVDDLATALLSPSALTSAAALPSVRSLRLPPPPRQSQLPVPPIPTPGSITQGAVVTGALDRHQQPIADDSRNVDGSGVKVAIFDGFARTAEFVASIEPSVRRRFCPLGSGAGGVCSYVSGADRYGDPNGETHGSNVAEIVLEMAPGASLFLYAPETSVEAAAMVQDAVAQGVDVITSSYSFGEYDFYDGTSPFAKALDAASQTTLVTVSLGNAQRTHSAERFNPDASGFQRWDAALHNGVSTCDHNGTSVSCLLIEFPGSAKTFYAYWSQFARERAGQSVADLRLHAHSPVDGTLIGSATPSGRPLASLRFNAGSEAYVSVQRIASAAPDPAWLQVDGINFLSVGQPTDLGARTSIDVGEAVPPKVLGIGATDWRDENVLDYSSLGPAIDESGNVLRTKPDLTGPTEVSTRIENGGIFNGTSAATPHVAGAAALLFDWCRNVLAGASCTADDIRTELIARAAKIDEAVIAQIAAGAGTDPVVVAYNDSANTIGIGRADFSPPLVFSSDDEVVARDPVEFADVDDGACSIGGSSNRGQEADVSPDGRKVVFEGVAPNLNLFVAPVDCSSAPQQITFFSGNDRALQPAWSPDGTKIVYVRREVQTLSGLLSVGYVLELVTPTGGSLGRVTTLDLAARDQQWWAFYPHWSPDGAKIGFTLATPNPSGTFANRAGRYELAEIDSTATNVRLNVSLSAYTLLTPNEPAAARGRYSPDGAYVLYVRIPRVESGPPLFRGQDGTLRILDRVSGVSNAMQDPLGVAVQGFDAEWSPRGTRLVYSSHTVVNDGQSSEIFLRVFRNNTLGVPVVEPAITQLTKDTKRSKGAAW